MEFTYDTTMFRSCFEHEFTWTTDSPATSGGSPTAGL